MNDKVMYYSTSNAVNIILIELYTHTHTHTHIYIYISTNRSEQFDISKTNSLSYTATINTHYSSALSLLQFEIQNSI